MTRFGVPYHFYIQDNMQKNLPAYVKKMKCPHFISACLSRLLLYIIYLSVYNKLEIRRSITTVMYFLPGFFIDNHCAIKISANITLMFNCLRAFVIKIVLCLAGRSAVTLKT